MKTTMYIALAIASIMMIASVPAALACDGRHCEVTVPHCRGCYVMTAEASLEAGSQGTSVSGSSTVLKNNIGTTTSVDIDAGRFATLNLEVGSEVSTRPTEIATYSVFDGIAGRADIEMDTTVVVKGGWHNRCLVNADASLDVTTTGVFEGGTLATYGMTPALGDGRMKEITVSQMVNGRILSADGDSEANNNLVPGTVYAGGAISPVSASNYAGATFYLSHFHP